MKKLLKALIGLSLMSSIAFASGVSAEHFEKKDGVLGGIVGDIFIFIYDKNEAGEVKEKLKLSVMASIVQKEICTGPDMRKLIDQTGLKILFVYPAVDEVTILKIDDCDGIPKPE